MAQGLPLFREAQLAGPVLYLDLDTVVCGDLEPPRRARLFTLRDARDGGHEEREPCHGYNSSVMAWTAPLYSEIWTLLNEDGAYEVITNCVQGRPLPEMVIEDARLVDGGVAEYASLTGPPSSNMPVVCFPLTPKPTRFRMTVFHVRVYLFKVRTSRPCHLMMMVARRPAPAQSHNTP